MATWRLLTIFTLFFIAIDPSKQQQQLESNNADTSIRIDCGGSTNFVDVYNQTWLSDRNFTGGLPATVSEPGSFQRVQERTLRFFPISSGKKSCYIVDVPSGRYAIGMFFIYGNYDNKNRPPSFDVSVEGTVVFTWRYPWSPNEIRHGVYSDLYSFINDGAATVCFYSIATDSPVIGALEIVQVDPLSYSSSITGLNVILVNYGRLSAAPAPFGSGEMNHTDVGVRAWEPDLHRAVTTSESKYFSTPSAISAANLAPDYYPEYLYQNVHTLPTPGKIEYLFFVDSSLDYMLCFHFAEIDPAVKGPGDRVFDIVVNGKTAYSAVDVVKQVGKFAAYDLTYTIKNLTGSALNVSLVSRVGGPMISGIENYAMLQMDMSTQSSEAAAMRALKDSLQIPERMGWNGDPCAPYNWDAWEGVTCNVGPNNRSLVITRLDVSGQGLRGSISDQIAMLPHLIGLNMSNNQLVGSIPSKVGGPALRSIDLSFNQLTGSIPESLGKVPLVKAILNNNQLSGQVPLSLYSIGVRGGFINISSNNALCGVPALPKCPYFWEKKKLSTGAKVGIALVILLGLVAVGGLIYYCLVWRKRQDDYNFGLPHKIVSKDLKYQRQKNEMMMRAGAAGAGDRTRSKFGFHSDLNPH